MKAILIKSIAILAIVLTGTMSFAEESKTQDSGSDASFISKSLIEETVTAPNGAVTVQDALNVNKLLGAHEKVVDELTEGVYHIRGWGIAHTIPASWALPTIR